MMVKDGGCVFAAIPQKEKTFDRYREKTPLIHLLHEISRETMNESK
jgi:hypothetical protein